jgi:hypothetical protein
MYYYFTELPLNQKSYFFEIWYQIILQNIEPTEINLFYVQLLRSSLEADINKQLQTSNHNECIFIGVTDEQLFMCSSILLYPVS